MNTIFESCRMVNDLLAQNLESKARDEVIRILDNRVSSDSECSPLLNHLIRQVGLYPYIDPDKSLWDDRYVFEVFKTDIGSIEPVTLHREQSLLLKKLLDGENLAISAPTSFGKSFIIDAFISIKKPSNVMILVPTIALTDETRRRLYPKFSSKYKIITTADVDLSDRNIFVFPQERAIEYADKIGEIDILIIDEFYKASYEFDQERSTALLRAMLKLREKAKQKYFLAPNITSVSKSLFTDDVPFVHLDFNTVILEKFEPYHQIKGNEQKKSEELVRILNSAGGKTLVYAGTYADIEKVTLVLQDEYIPKESSTLLDSFSRWLEVNYSSDWNLVKLVRKGIGIHNGQLHRSLSQIQIKLFEEANGLRNLVSTSSIIEGVNTSAENVILWRNRNGRHRLKDFTYRNIIGRGGRMFKHFIGKVFLLEKPPESDNIPLNIDVPDELLSDIDEVKYKSSLSGPQISKIIQQREEMTDLLGKDLFAKLRDGGDMQMNDWNLVKEIAIDLRSNPGKWRGLAYLHSPDTGQWESSIYNILHFKKGWWDIKYSSFVFFIRVLSLNWVENTPELLNRLKVEGIGVGDFFKLERNVTYKLASLMRDVNLLQMEMLPQNKVDVSPFIARISHAFLPPLVYQMEEYGLPRNIAKKIQFSGVFDFLQDSMSLHQAVEFFNEMGQDSLVSSIPFLDEFDKYIISYFFEGISNGVRTN